jgi:peptidoglycan/xylan/chitin deacetylase (PgdA/CDA1 family)
MLLDSALFLLIQMFVLYTTSTFTAPQVDVLAMQKEAQSMPKSDSLTRHVYLTFDDGPLPGSSNCIDICMNEQVKASFFEIGLHYEKMSFGKKVYNRIISQPTQFVICNHSMTHAFMGKYLEYYHHPDLALSDFIQGGNILHVKNKIARLPGNNGWVTKQGIKGSGLVKPLLQKLDSVGVNVVGWDMEWHFNKAGRPIAPASRLISLADSLFTHNLTKNKNHLVILMHDHMFRHSEDSAKLVALVKGLKQMQHVQFDKITDYPNLKN